MIHAGMPEKIVKIWENGCSVCAHHFDHLEATWKTTTAFYPMYCRCAPVQKHFATSLQGATQKLSICSGSAKNEDSATICAHQNAIKLCNLKKNVLVAFYRGWYVVVHHVQIFLCATPLQSIKFQTADFPIFCSRIIAIF